MPEGPEVETEKLHEAIKEELEHEGGSFLRSIAITTALVAALAAVAALMAGGRANKALFVKTESAEIQAKASDQWAYYQAKGIKLAIQEASRNAWLAAGKEPPADLEKAVKRYSDEQDEIKVRAQELEKERDAKAEEAEHLLHTHHLFANAVTLFQVAIALGAVAALTRVKPVWWASILVGAGGLALFAFALAA